jgi:hypothetical protein
MTRTSSSSRYCFSASVPNPTSNLENLDIIKTRKMEIERDRSRPKLGSSWRGSPKRTYNPLPVAVRSEELELWMDCSNLPCSKYCILLGVPSRQVTPLEAGLESHHHGETLFYLRLSRHAFTSYYHGHNGKRGRKDSHCDYLYAHFSLL